MISHALVAATVLSIGLAAAPAPAAVPQELPPKSIKHKNSQYWSWAGPRNWVSADGAYGIQITSGNGRLGIDLGFSSTVCATGATVQDSVTAYYAGQRQTLRQNLRANWTRVRMDSSRIRQLPEGSYGPVYFRQVLQVSGRAQGRPVGGQIELDYSLANGPTYCYSRSVSRTAPAAGFRTSMRQLRSVQASLAYFGPGAPLDPTD